MVKFRRDSEHIFASVCTMGLRQCFHNSFVSIAPAYRYHATVGDRQPLLSINDLYWESTPTMSKDSSSSKLCESPKFAHAHFYEDPKLRVAALQRSHIDSKYMVLHCLQPSSLRALASRRANDLLLSLSSVFMSNSSVVIHPGRA